jgi:hypothetical protein
MRQHLFVFVTCGVAVACGGARVQPASPTTTSAQVVPAQKEAEPAPAPAAETPAQAPAPGDEQPQAAQAEAPAAPEPAKAPALEPCDGWWVCVSVSPKNKIDKRMTQLIGDPAFESTQSGMIDDARGPAKLDLEGKTYEVSLRRGFGGAQIVLRRADGASGEIVLDKHKGTDFSYVGVIAAKSKEGAVLVDIKYMK